MQPRVLMIVAQFWPIVGGAETQARRLAAELRRQGTHVEIWTGRWSRGVPAREEIDGVPVRRLGPGLALQPIRLRRWLFLVLLFAELLRRGREFDVFHTHQLLYPAFAAAVAGRMLRRPAIARISSTGSTSDLVMSARGGLGLQRALLRKYLTRVVAVNRAAERECLESGYRPEQIVRIPNGLPGDFASTGTRTSAESVRVLYVGGLRPEKRIELLLEAWRLAEIPGTLTLAGDGSERARLDAQGAALPGVRFLGHVADAQTLYSEADVFVLSSDAEGMSNALLEAMASGCACVATHVGGNIDALGAENGPPPAGFAVTPAGLLVRVGDAAGLAAALRRLATDPPFRAALGEAAARRCRSEFSLAGVAERYRRLYEELASASA